MDNQSWVGKQLREGIRLIDSLIRKSERSYEYCDDPDCILRVQLMPCPHATIFGGMAIQKGEPVLAVHVWNERMPPIPPSGADLQWAIHLRRQVLHSFRKLAKVMQDDELYTPVRAIYGASVLFSSTSHTGGNAHDAEFRVYRRAIPQPAGEIWRVLGEPFLLVADVCL